MKFHHIPSPHALIAFEAAARRASFTAAARELGVGQPAVSHQITALEEQLGQPLFRRKHRGVSLTRAGQELFDCISVAFGQIDRTVERIKTRRSARLSVGTDFAFASFILMPHLPEFIARHPDIEVNVVTNQTGHFAADQNIDIEISFGNCHPEDVMLIPEQVTPVCSPAFLEARGHPKNIADLRHYPLIHLDDEIDHRWFNWESWLRTAGVRETGRLYGHRFNTYLLVLSATLSGQGVALGWTALLQQHLKTGQLVTLGDVTLGSDRGYVLSCRSNTHRQEQINAFLGWARDLVAQNPETDETPAIAS